MWTGWMRWHKGFGPGVHESTDILSSEKHPCSGSRRSAIFIMRTTLHDDAPNTYYGQWLRLVRAKTREMSRSIAHREAASSARFRRRS